MPLNVCDTRTLPCDKKRVRESELVVFSKCQQAFAVIVELITSVRFKHPTVTTLVHPLPSPRVCAYQYEQTFLGWNLFNQVPQFIPLFLFQLCVGVGFRWGIGNN